MSPAHGRNIVTTHHRKFSIASYASSKHVLQLWNTCLSRTSKSPSVIAREDITPYLSIGDRLNGRYDVVHKLGFRTYSTTWLAGDTNLEKYVAIKIVIAEADSPERNILDTLAPALSEPNDEGQLIPRVLDTFTLDGPNGNHTCLVTEPGMMSLAEAKDASYTRLFTIPVARAIAAQLIQAVAFLHRQGVVHAGMYTHHGDLNLAGFRSVPSINDYDS
ncbi:uncharacterized protein LDX57_008156 [Aspergillus melleus]|uniref:uncharacterized protein n=1 Tax=Aspergillus melleus TaxID=138277 RepID=UPI001E8D3BEA|nr:uncharacterized protein LDX57_008156 [Aspergillus melleus]KAH8430494.1 hypothetical protein LDX57_008156 [Aspergillus melleus]